MATDDKIVIKFRSTVKEKEAYEAWAKSAGVTLSTWIRRKLDMGLAMPADGQAGDQGPGSVRAAPEPVVSPALPEKVTPPEKPRPIMLDLATARELGRLRRVDLETGEVREEKLPGKVAMEVRNTWVAANQEGRGPEAAERLASRYPDYAGQIRTLVTRLEEGTA